MRSTLQAAANALLVACLALSVGRALAQQSTPQEAPTTTAKAELDAMQAIEDTWSQGLLKRDQFALEGVLAPGYVDISADGEVTTRNQQIGRLFAKDADATSFEQRVASVRLFGDIAVVNGTYVLRYTRDGRPIDDKGIFSQVFQKTRGRWMCINSQRTFVVEQSGSAKKAGVLPFHLPGTRPAGSPPKPAPAPAQATPPPANSPPQ